VIQRRLLVLILAAAVAFLAGDKIAKSQTGEVCSGKLVKESDGGLTIVDGEDICVVDPAGTQKVLSACAEGHDCEIEGRVYPCEDAGECSAIKNIVSVKDLTALGARQR
jgi:hypothetical protein